MKTTDLFTKPTARKLVETTEKVFGNRLPLETFSLAQLEDARNRLRTIDSQRRSKGAFNETVTDESYTNAKWLLDAINAEIAERDDFFSEDIDVESITESATDKASAVVTAKSLVDKISRWIEELANMENDTLLSLGDTIRDEMGQDMAKHFLSSAAPAIQSSLNSLKSSREVLATGVRTLTGDVQSAEMIGQATQPAGARPASKPGEFGTPEIPNEPEIPESEPDMMNPPEEEFGASEPAVGGEETLGRPTRESIQFSGDVLRTLAG